MRSAGYHEKMIGRTCFGGDQVTQLNLVLYNTIKWPYQPKHSPSIFYFIFSTRYLLGDNQASGNLYPLRNDILTVK